MRTLTIAQKRERELNKLAELGGSMDQARYLMNSYYRLAALCERNFYLSNDERTHDLKSTKRSEEREMQWIKRLDRAFYEFIGANITFCGIYPSICYMDKERGNCIAGTAVDTFFY